MIDNIKPRMMSCALKSKRQARLREGEMEMTEIVKQIREMRTAATSEAGISGLVNGFPRVSFWCGWSSDERATGTWTYGIVLEAAMGLIAWMQILLLERECFCKIGQILNPCLNYLNETRDLQIRLGNVSIWPTCRHEAGLATRLLGSLGAITWTKGLYIMQIVVSLI